MIFFKIGQYVGRVGGGGGDGEILLANCLLELPGMALLVKLKQVNFVPSGSLKF